ncbi:MAG: DNA/RNA helicase domain-containing protein [Bacilli bacterium]
MRAVNLCDVISISNAEIRDEYIKYICDFDTNKTIKDEEIQSLISFLECLNLQRKIFDGFFYSYSIPQIGKEFDLIKIKGDSILNIELKSKIASIDTIKQQLSKNLLYFNVFKGKKYLFCFVQNTKKLYKYSDDILKMANFEELKNVLNEFITNYSIEINNFFQASNFLISPFNTPEKFLDHQYFLTVQQDEIRHKILEGVDKNKKFFGITGNPGTGKTLLLYDLAIILSKLFKVGIIHCGLLNEGQHFLNNACNNIDIVEVKSLKYREIKEWQAVLIDETHRIYLDQLKKVINWINKTDAFAIFSFDKSQTLSKAEDYRKISEKIIALCGTNGIFKLSNKIRTNKEIASFIKKLFNKTKDSSYNNYKNIYIFYGETLQKADKIVKFLEENYNFKYIAYTPSAYHKTNSIVYNEVNNSHRVIGQEFDNVVMTMGEMYYYEKNVLKSTKHPNPDYLYEKMLYQGLTRVREKLAIVVYNNEKLMKEILDILKLSNKI